MATNRAYVNFSFFFIIETLNKFIKKLNSFHKLKLRGAKVVKNKGFSRRFEKQGGLQNVSTL